MLPKTSYHHITRGDGVTVRNRSAGTWEFKGRAQLLDRKGEGIRGDTSGTQANITGGAKSAETRYVYIRINSIGATILSKCVKKQI